MDSCSHFPYQPALGTKKKKAKPPSSRDVKSRKVEVCPYNGTGDGTSGSRERGGATPAPRPDARSARSRAPWRSREPMEIGLEK
jgi:hypothetical protein